MSKENDNQIFSNELIKVLESKENQPQWDMKRYVDGEPKNVNPITEIPPSQMRLYGFESAFKSAYFDTEEELIDYIKTTKNILGSVCVLDYLGEFAGRSDVIRATYKSGKKAYYTAVDEDGYGKYNFERSVYRGEFIWEFQYGNIREMYKPFRDRGIVFEDDVYAKIDEYYKKILEMCDERKIFTGNRKKANNDKEQNFEVLAVPCDKPFVVAPDKTEEFLNSKPDSEKREQMKKNAKRFTKQLKKKK